VKDPVFDLIAQLPHASVAPDRARHTLKRCHRVLERQARHDAAAPLRPWQAWSRALVVLGTAYFVEAVRQALHAYGLR